MVHPDKGTPSERENTAEALCRRIWSGPGTVLRQEGEGAATE